MEIALIFIGVLLIVFNIKAIKKEKTSFSSTLKDKEENTTEIMIEIGEIRREFAETLLSVQQDMEVLKDRLNLKEAVVEVEVEEESKNINDNSIKIREIQALMNNGLNIDEISEKLGIGKGEVLLIKELYLK